MYHGRNICQAGGRLNFGEDSFGYSAQPSPNILGAGVACRRPEKAARALAKRLQGRVRLALALTGAQRPKNSDRLRRCRHRAHDFHIFGRKSEHAAYLGFYLSLQRN